MGHLKENPCAGIKALKESPGRVRYLDPAEYERLTLALDPETLRRNPYNAGRTLSPLLRLYLKPIVIMALHSGLRRSELVSLRRRDIDWKHRRIVIEKTKNKERLVLPMNATLSATVHELLARLDTDRLFPNVTLGMVTSVFRRAVKRAEIQDFTYHDLRHCFASQLTMAGVGLRAVQTLLGHKDVRMTLRYSHLSPEHLRGTVTLLDGAFTNEN